MISWLHLLATLSVNCMLAAGDTEEIFVNNQGRKIGEMTPEVAMDFKVIVYSYEQECYYLKLTTNDIFHFIINVSLVRRMQIWIIMIEIRIFIFFKFGLIILIKRTKIILFFGSFLAQISIFDMVK